MNVRESTIVVVLRATWRTFQAETKKPQRNPKIKKIYSYISGNEALHFLRKFFYIQKVFFLYFRKRNFLTFQETEIRKTSYIPESKKFLIFREMGKISCTRGLLLILFAERKLYKHKREITFSSLPAAAFACRSRFKFRLYEQFLIFLLS